MSLKLRLNLIITALLSVVLLVGAVLTVQNARGDIRAEVESTANLALHLLDAEIKYYTSAYAGLGGADPSRSSIFRLENLGNIRHLRIDFVDPSGRLRDSNRSSGIVSEAAPPQWFVRLLQLSAYDQQQTRRKIFANGRLLGELVVTRDPSYEVAEIWSDTVGLLSLMASLFFVINLVVYWAVGRALEPVAKILAALAQLEKGRLDVRLPGFDLPEMASIAGKFNSMAGALQASIERNRRLTQRIVNLQEDERKSLARDLHDEIGQSLTAISSDAAAIQETATLDSARVSARAIGEVSRQLMDLVHSMLQRLRPGALDELGLPAALRELVTSWVQRHPRVQLGMGVAAELGPLDEAVATTLYRSVQECLTNVARHSGAKHVTVRVALVDDNVELSVDDDGAGFDMAAGTGGFGLAGMRERVEGLGGLLQLRSERGRGTTVVVSLPRWPEASR